MKTIKKISLFFILACIFQFLSIDTAQASSNGRQHQKHRTNKTYKTAKRKLSPNQKNHHGGAAAEHRNQSGIKNPEIAVAGAAAHNNNQQQQQMDNAMEMWNNYCNNNQSDARCNHSSETSSSTPTIL